MFCFAKLGGAFCGSGHLALQVDLKGYSHEVLIVRGPEDDRWRLLDAGFGGITPTQPLILQNPADDSFTGAHFAS